MSNRVNTFKDIAKAELCKHGLTDWRFTYDGARTRAGYANSVTKTISMSCHAVRSKHVMEQDLMNILWHEIAHAIVGVEHKHDDVWRAKALELGCDGKRCHHLNFDLQYKFELSCQCGTRRMHRITDKARKMVGLNCKRCNAVIKGHRV